MNQLQHKGLLALTILEEKPATLDELTDKLCTCRRNTHRVLKHLKDSGFVLKTRISDRKKYFWLDQSPDLLPAILTLPQKQALRTALVGPNPILQEAVYNLVQYVNMQRSFHIHK